MKNTKIINYKILYFFNMLYIKKNFFSEKLNQLICDNIKISKKKFGLSPGFC